VIGKTISHYRVIEQIGVGGMGEVYRAVDPRLERDVAIKVLPGAFSKNPDRLLRFEREARAVGSLNHPNVLAIYDVGDDDGVPYIVSELLQGETLRERMDSGLLTRGKAVEYAVFVAEGLAAAHAKRIVHRDLKPQNVFLTRDGHVKILDFGLAKLVHEPPEDGETAEGPTADMVTEEGSVVGTAAYMSPEQLQGLAVDHRSDIFAFGVMLYEMLADRRPFEGDSKAQVVASILRDDPPDLSDPRHHVPPTLERIIRQCLEKRPEDRFESAHDLAFTLRAISESGVSAPSAAVRTPLRRRVRATTVVLAVLVVAALASWKAVTWISTPVLPENKSLAVLPIDTVGDDSEHALVAVGLRENLLDGLFLLEMQTAGSVRIAPRYNAETLEQAWRREAVSLGINGRLALREDRVRLDLSLLEADGGSLLRSVAIDDQMSNLSCLQREPIQRIAEMLGQVIEPETEAGLDSLTSIVQQACMSCLRGRGLIGRSSQSLDQGIKALGEAIAEDPGYGLARIAMARACLLKFDETGDRSWIERGVEETRRVIDMGGLELLGTLEQGRIYLEAERVDEAIESFTAATRIAGWSDEAFLGLGSAYEAAARLEEAEAAYQSAISRRPDHWRGHQWLGFLYWTSNRFDAAANQFHRVTEVVPDNPDGYNNFGGVLATLGRRDEALEVFQRSLEVKPNGVAYSQLGTLHFIESRYGSAAEMQERALELAPDDFDLLVNLAASYHWGGRRDRASEVFAQAIEVGETRLDSGDEDLVLMARLASCHAMIGNSGRARTLLDSVIDRPPNQARVMGLVAEAFENLGERELALEWIGSALDQGLTVEWIEERPSLSRLEEDSRFRRLIDSREETITGR